MHAKKNKNKKESVDACRWNNNGSELVTAIFFTVFVIGLGLLHLVKNTASKYFEAAESNHTVIDPCIVNQAMEAEEDSLRCVNCGNSGSKKCSRCKSVRYW